MGNVIQENYKAAAKVVDGDMQALSNAVKSGSIAASLEGMNDYSTQQFGIDIEATIALSGQKKYTETIEGAVNKTSQ